MLLVFSSTCDKLCKILPSLLVLLLFIPSGPSRIPPRYHQLAPSSTQHLPLLFHLLPTVSPSSFFPLRTDATSMPKSTVPLLRPSTGCNQPRGPILSLPTSPHTHSTEKKAGRAASYGSRHCRWNTMMCSRHTAVKPHPSITSVRAYSGSNPRTPFLISSSFLLNHFRLSLHHLLIEAHRPYLLHSSLPCLFFRCLSLPLPPAPSALNLVPSPASLE